MSHIERLEGSPPTCFPRGRGQKGPRRPKKQRLQRDEVPELPLQPAAMVVVLAGDPVPPRTHITHKYAERIGLSGMSWRGFTLVCILCG